MAKGLTVREIEKLGRGKSRSERGLMIRERGGRKEWTFGYKRAGRRESLTSGEFPALGLAEARARAGGRRGV